MVYYMGSMDMFLFTSHHFYRVCYNCFPHDLESGAGFTPLERSGYVIVN
jgi:hypothetical protein